MHFTRSQIYKLPTMFKTTRTAQQTPPKPPIGQAAPLVCYWLPSPLAAEARAAPAPAPSVPVSVPCGCRGSTPSCRESILRARLRSRRLQGIDTRRRRRLRRSPRRRGVDQLQHQPHRHQVARGSARYGDPPPLFPWIDPPPSPHLDRSVLGRLLLHRCVVSCLE